MTEQEMTVSNCNDWTSHTPGPWEHKRGYIYGDGLRVATLDPAQFEEEVAMKAADARLIAAAPDLLKTLQWIAETCDQVIDEPSQDINATELPYTDLIDMITAIRAEAFIAKTESGGEA